MRLRLRLIALALTCMLSGWLNQGAGAQPKPLSKVEIAKRGKAATAMVASNRSPGTAVCINPSGLFLTTNRVVQSAGRQPIRLVLDPGLKTQRVLTGKLLRSDATLDLALLKVEAKEKLPALSLGSTEGLTELAEMVVLGFPTDRRPSPERQEYPSVNVRAGSISSLQRSGGKLTRIQVDVNPGYPGGPILDQHGKVVALVVGSSGARASYGCPVDQLKAFVKPPMVDFEPPVINRLNRHRAVTFEVQAGHVLPSDKPLEVELKLSGPDKDRTVRMKHQEGTWRAELVPLPTPRQETVRVVITFPDGRVEGMVANRTVGIGNQKVKLNNVHLIRFGEKGEVTTTGGQRLNGAITELRTVDLDLGGETLKVSIAEGAQLRVVQPKRPTQLTCTLVVKENGTILARVEKPVTVHDRLLQKLHDHNGRAHRVAFSPDGSLFASGTSYQPVRGRAGDLWIWSTRTWKPVQELKGHTEGITGVAFSPDGKQIASSSYDGTAMVWNVAKGTRLHTLRGHSDQVVSIAYSPDGKRIVTASVDRSATVWDAVTGKALLSFKGHHRGVDHVAWSPDGKSIVSASLDNTLIVWDANTGQFIKGLWGHVNPVDCVAWSPDGKQIVSGSQDKTVTVWDAKTGRALRNLKSHTSHVYDVAYSPDGKRIYSASSDKTVKVWDAQTGRELFTLNGHVDQVFCVASSPDGRQVVSGCRDGTLWRWHVSDDQEPQRNE